MIKRWASWLCPKVLRHVPKTWKWLYPFYLAGQLNLQREDYASPAIPATFSGFRIAYASDIHYGPLFSKQEALRLYDRLVALRADLTILGGDYGDLPINARAFFELIPPFPANMTVVAVAGNHDSGVSPGDEAALAAIMRKRNIIPLINQVYQVEKAGSRMAVCGPADILSGQPDFTPLQAGAAGADLVLFIPHSPDLIPEAQKAGFAFDLALCGHTHGGQITLFGRSLHSSSRYGDRYRSGWYREQGVDIFVSEGVGTSILPMRLGTRAMLHELTLGQVGER